ncbi:fimbrial protein [Pseudomonas iridis]|uniref:Fimbrial protein n=1 Tax=Pseudomonas iridis TaxID=2710587 RepID=A0ABW8DPM3_9PSED
MHDSTVKPQRPKWATIILWSVGLLFSFASQQAFAIVQNNMTCTATGSTGVVELGTLSPSENIDVNMTANCRVTRWYPVGSNLSFTQQYNMGAGDKYTGFHINSGKYLSTGGMGTTGTTCVPSSCVPLKVGTTFSYNVLFSGRAGATPGNYMVSLNLFDTSIGGWEGYADYLQTIVLSYTVAQPACSLGSAKTMNLSFGTLNSNDFASTQQVANVTMNCIRGTQVTATLVPTQAAVSGSAGVSATTLAGLSMAATWADNDSAVTFNSPRTLTLAPGANRISLGFRPRLNTSVSPTGNFSSQYTLNITYR